MPGKRRRVRAWHIVNERTDKTLMLAMPLFNNNKTWTDFGHLAAIYWTRREAADVLRMLFPGGDRDVRVVPVFLRA